MINLKDRKRCVSDLNLFVLKTMFLVNTRIHAHARTHVQTHTNTTQTNTKTLKKPYLTTER